MADKLSRFIESLIEEHGVWRVVAAPFTIVPIVAAFGVVGGDSAVAAVSALLVLALSFVVVVALTAQLRKERLARERRNRIIVRLTDTIREEVSSAYTWEWWRHKETVSAGGDTLIEEWRRLRVNQGRAVRVLWSGRDQGDDSRLTRAQRRAITADVYRAHQEDGRWVQGVRFDSVMIWLEREQAFLLYVYLDDPLTGGDQLDVHFRWWWPGHYRELVQGGTDVVAFRRKVGRVDRIDLEMLFTPASGISQPMRLEPRRGCSVPSQTIDHDGLHIRATYDADLPDVAGFTLDNSGFRP